jgi:Flp pilus assembly protein TadD
MNMMQENARSTSTITAGDFLDAFRRGQLAEAERFARARLSAQPGDATAANVLGLSLLHQRRLGEAAAIFRELVRQHPGEASFWGNLGTVLRADGRLAEAEDAYSKVLHLQRDDPQALANLGFLNVESKRVVRARDLLLASLRLQPDDAEVRIYAAQMCLECGDEAQARQLLQDWRAWQAGLDGVLRVELAALLLRLGQDADGETLLRAQLGDPRTGDVARARLILVLERFNRLDEARALQDELPDPDRVPDPALREEILEANAMLASRMGDVSRARALLESLDAGASSGNRKEVDRWFLLAKWCDQLGDYPACVDYLRRAHAGQMKVAVQLVPELAEPSANPLNIVDFYVTPEQRQAWKPVDEPSVEDSPVFVLGFPRSGTTMLEQMLDAHPGLVSMDERPFVQRVVERMQAMSLEYPDQLGELDSERCSELRDHYWQAVREVVTLQPGQRLVDKNPLTMLRLPLLVRLFPRAKIVFVMRHPCDVVLSNYMQHFNAPAYVALCSTLPRLAAGYAAAMKFWNEHFALLKPDVFEWRYETAIADFHGMVSRLGEFLELDDIAPLRDFNEHARRKGYIGTPSYAQVVQPVYASSIGRWRNYRDSFESLLPILRPAMDHWDYEA